MFKGNLVDSRQEGGAVVKQPAAVPQQNVLAPIKRFGAQSLQSGPTLRSWFPGFGYSAYETSGWPSRQAGRAYNGSAKYVKHRKHDQSACYVILLISKVGHRPIFRPRSNQTPTLRWHGRSNSDGFDRNAYLFILMLYHTPKLLNFMGLTFGTAEVLLDGQQPKDVRGTH